MFPFLISESPYETGSRQLAGDLEGEISCCSFCIATEGDCFCRYQFIKSPIYISYLFVAFQVKYRRVHVIWHLLKRQNCIYVLGGLWESQTAWAGMQKCFIYCHHLTTCKISKPFLWSVSRQLECFCLQVIITFECRYAGAVSNTASHTPPIFLHHSKWPE